MRKKPKTPRNTAKESTKEPESFQAEVVEPDMLTTAQAARLAGVSPSTIVRHREQLEAEGPIGPKGAYLFRTEVVRQNITRLRTRVAVTPLGPTSGEVAAAVFAALKAGKEPWDIVIEQRVSPEVVSALKDQYDHMHGRIQGWIPPKTKCRCGSGHASVFCVECARLSDSPSIDRRTQDGREEVRVFLGPNYRKRDSSAVYVELFSAWFPADSPEGRDVVEALEGSDVSTNEPVQKTG